MPFRKSLTLVYLYIYNTRLITLLLSGNITITSSVIIKPSFYAY